MVGKLTQVQVWLPLILEEAPLGILPRTQCLRLEPCPLQSTVRW